MTKPSKSKCGNCGSPAVSEVGMYRYAESGIPNVVLQGIATATCPACGNIDVSIPRIGELHRTIAHALTNSPVRLTGPQLRFLRKHLGLNGDELGGYLHTDKTKISKWETGEDRIGPATDRLMRLLTTALDEHLRTRVAEVARILPRIQDQSGGDWELHIDVVTLTYSFMQTSKAA